MRGAAIVVVAVVWRDGRLRGSGEKAFEEAVEVGAGGLVHADEFDAHSAARVGVADDGASADFAFGRVDKELNVSAGGGRVGGLNVEAAHAEGFGAVRTSGARSLPGDEHSFLQLLSRVAARRWFFLGHFEKDSTIGASRTQFAILAGLRFAFMVNLDCLHC